MNSLKIYLNEYLIEIVEGPDLIQELKFDDLRLIEYVTKAIKCEKIPFLSEEDLATVQIQRYESDEEQLEDSPSYDGINYEPSTSACSSIQSVWVNKGKPTEADNKATEAMLRLRGSDKYVSKFNDKKSVKLNIWRDIADEMKAKGYDVDGEKCRQKFANLQKSYISFVRHVHTTGSEKRAVPEFYELLHIILGEKDKATLKELSDTLPVEKETPPNESLLNEPPQPSNESLPNEPPQPANESLQNKHQCSKRAIPKAKQVTKQDLLKRIHQDEEKQDTNFNKMMEVLQEQNRQRQQLIEIFQNIASEKMKKKRKRKASSDESE